MRGRAIGESPRLLISLVGVEVDALMDTGSNVTTISEEMFRCHFQDRLHLHPNDMYFRLRGVNGEELPMVGYLVADLTVGSEVIPAAVIMVVSNPISPCLVGMNVLRRMESPPFPLGPRPQTKFLVRSRTAEVVPPHSVRHINATAGLSSTSVSVALEPPETSLSRGLCPLPILGNVSQGLIRVPLVNLSDESITVAARSIVAVAHEAVIRQVEVTEESVPERSQSTPDWSLLDINPDLEPGDRARLDALLVRYKDSFAWSDMDFGYTDRVKHQIRLTCDTPQARPFRRIPPSALAEVKSHIEDLLSKGIIEPSSSPYAAPIVVVRKKNGDIRLCCDYRALNAVTRRDSFPLPRIDDCLDAIGGSAFFSTLDLKSGYHQVAIAEEDQAKTAFICPFGLYQWRRLPFGLSGAPMTFQRVMNQVMSDLIFKIVLVYLDDLLVYSSSFDRHLHALELVLSKISDEGLKLNPEKCQLAHSEVAFLGHRISAAGVGPDPGKVEAVLNFPVPQTARAVRSFVGLASYYRRFIKDFSKKAAPLNQLIPAVHGKYPEDRYKGERRPLKELWTTSCMAAFQLLKMELCGSDVLAHPDFQREFILDMDASNQGLGAVLSQVQPDGRTKVIAYASRTLRKAERNMSNYSSQKLELCALRWAVCEKFRPYLLGHPFTAYTDNNPLSHLDTAKFGAVEQRWVADLSPFDMTIKYRPGRVNRNADALSRYPVGQPLSEETPVSAVSQISADTPLSLPPPTFVPPEIPMTPVDVCVQVLHTPTIEMLSPEELSTAQQLDPDIGPFIASLKGENNTASKRDWSSATKTLHRLKSSLIIQDGVLKREVLSADNLKRLLVVLPKSHRQVAIQLAHDRTGHQGSERTAALLRLRCYWPRQDDDVAEYVRTCRGCQISKRPTDPINRKPGHLTASEPLEVLAMDFLTLDKAANGTENVLVFTDVFTKFSVAVGTTDQTAATVVRHLMTSWIPHYGVPLRLHSDRGKSFEADILNKLCRAYNIDQSRTTPRHPAGNGQTERFNRTLLNLLRCLGEEQKQRWPSYLGEATFFYNSTPHSSTGQSPFALMFGRQPRLPLDIYLNGDVIPKSTSEDLLKDHLQRLGELRRVARQRVERRHAAEDARHRPNPRAKTLHPGDLVLLANHPPGRHKLANAYKDQLHRVTGVPELSGHGYFTIVGSSDGIKRNVTEDEIRLFNPRTEVSEPLSPQVPPQPSFMEPLPDQGYHYVTISTPIQQQCSPGDVPPTMDPPSHLGEPLRRSTRARKPPDRYFVL